MPEGLNVLELDIYQNEYFSKF